MRSWLALSLLASIGCAANVGGGGDDDGSGSGPGSGPGGNTGGFKISGSVGHQSARARAPEGVRVVTHVMAVQPISASPIRTVAEVKADGSFSLDVTPGQPYVFVFVDSTATG
ncbi:MAG TPA: hypothetical protein VGM39_05295, partial [Kofleriaceae bacterium]